MSKPLPFEIAVILLAAIGYYFADHEMDKKAKAASQAHGAVAEAIAANPNVSVAYPAGAAAVTSDHAFSADFVKTAMPVQQLVADTLRVSGKLSLDKRQLRIASSRVAGRLGRIFVFEGQSVKEGEPLAEIYSPDYIAAEHEFVLAKSFRDTMSKDSADAELREDAEATYRSAANKLKVLGATVADIGRLARTGVVDEYLRVNAPIAGVVVQRNVDPGGYLNVGDSLMVLANLDTLWLLINTYDSDYPSLKIGQSLSFQTPSLPGQEFSGKIAFIAPSIDPATHTLPIRCDVPNAQFLLRPEMFVTGVLTSGQRNAWVVPRSAVIHIRDTDYVIVQDDAKHYRRLAVQGHPFEADLFAITDGLDRAVPVVSDGGVLLNERVGEG